MARLRDGHPTTIAFANFPSVLFWEKTVTPPGIEGGGENDTTTMRNSVWRTRQPKKLKTLSNSTFTAAYDPAVYEDILDMIQDNQLITVTFSDGATLAFWGWVDSFVAGEIREGEQPMATITIIPSNEDDDANEVAPVYTAAA